MRSATLRPIGAAALALGPMCFAAGVALAGPISISPVSVTLTPPASVAQITIRNPSDELLRLQVSASEWLDTPDGSIKLKPTSDVVVFPQLVTVPLFGKQEIRAAVMTPPGALEKTYRVVLDVLPPPPSAADRLNAPGVQLRIHTRFTIPIFLEPMALRLSGEIAAAAIKRGAIDFTLVNSGNAHLGGDEIRIVGRDAAGKVIFTEPFRGWYVGVQGKRTFSFHAPQKGCRDVRSVTIAAPGYMNVRPTSVEAQSGVCGA